MPLVRRTFLHAGLALGTGIWSTSAQACEVQLPNLRLMHPWTRATAPGADSAILNFAIEDVTEADRLVGVQCLVAAGAALGGPGAQASVNLEIPMGRPLLLGEDGTHVLLTGLRMPLHVGRVYPLLVMFEKAGVAMASLHVDFPGLS
jgi:copper(I)-binding protein